ncbi:hypothetical protein LCGC14_1324150 [marine sediment metagenome]|uniref:Uncharacterized protein n=1 Tax=marine sediment metagenome TaxID=412755 RepID=A0A0F9NL06_9ZZZZ
MSIATFNSLYTAAAAALDSGDYASAILAATKAQILLGTTPNLARSLGGQGDGNQSVTWNDGAAIERFIANCRQLQKAASVASGGVFAQSKVTYARPTA